jgi:Yip1 domain
MEASSAPAALEWQTFSPSPPGTLPMTPDAPVSASGVSSDAASLGGRSPADENFSVLSLLSPAFYKSVFDVDVADVTVRVRAALWPFRPPTPFLSLIAAKPDLYGPVWLAATLVFIIGAGSNVSSWLNFSSTAAKTIWQYDFQSLSKALFFVFGFSFGAPLAVWACMTYALPRSLGLGLVSLVCVYGYAIAPFIPAAVSVRAPLAIRPFQARGARSNRALLPASLSSAAMRATQQRLAVDCGPRSDGNLRGLHAPKHVPQRLERHGGRLAGRRCGLRKRGPPPPALHRQRAVCLRRVLEAFLLHIQ